jgi:hypothetical protein
MGIPALFVPISHVGKQHVDPSRDVGAARFVIELEQRLPEPSIAAAFGSVDELVEHGDEVLHPPVEIVFRQGARASTHRAPVVDRAFERDARDAAQRAHPVVEVGLHGVHEDDLRRGSFHRPRGREVADDEIAPSPDVLGNQVGEGREDFRPRVVGRPFGEVVTSHLERLPARVADEAVTKLFGVALHVRGKPLRQREPHGVG